jgi:streptomycin 6-kinase
MEAPAAVMDASGSTGAGPGSTGPFAQMRRRAWQEIAKAKLDAGTAERFERQLARWELRVAGRPIAWTGAADLVIHVSRVDGTPAVLKLNSDDEEVRHEHLALRAYDGDGAVRLLESEPDGRALLLERLEPGTALESHPDREEAIEIVCGPLRRLWRASPSQHPFVTATELARRWAQELPVRFEQAGQPFEPRLLDAALAACAELVHPAGKPVIANRDVHLGNVLAAQREPWLLIDPQPVSAEPAFDLAYLAQDLLPRRPRAADLRAVLDRLAGELEVSRERVRLWMLVRQLDNALEGIASNESWGRRDVAVARALFDAGP